MEFCFGFMFFSPVSFRETSPPALWKYGKPGSWAGFPSAVERRGNSAFKLSPLSMARHFQSAGFALWCPPSLWLLAAALFAQGFAREREGMPPGYLGQASPKRRPAENGAE